MSILSVFFSPTSLDIIKLQGIMSDEKDEINFSNLRQITFRGVWIEYRYVDDIADYVL
jgi:hypothetical protein